MKGGVEDRAAPRDSWAMRGEQVGKQATEVDVHSHLCHSTDMTLFRLNLRPGESIFDQLVFAAKKAFVSGELQTGQAFPSVRALAAEF